MIETIREHKGAATVAAITLAGVAGLSGCSANTGPQPYVSYGETMTMDPVPQLGDITRDTCDVPSEDTMQKVRDLINQPENPALQAGDIDTDPTGYQKLITNFKVATAKKLGVTYIDNQKTLDAMVSSPSAAAKDTKPFRYFLQTAQDFTKAYGVDIQVMQPDDPHIDFGAHVPTKAELENGNAKLSMRGIVEGLGNETVEYQQTSGVKHIKLMAGASEPTTTADGKHAQGIIAGYVPFGAHHDTMYLNIGTDVQAETVAHEESHARHEAQCGVEVLRDPAFVATGDAAYTGVTYDDKNSFSGDYPKRASTFDRKMSEASKAHDQAAYCKAFAGYVAVGKSIQFATPYHPQPVEAQAEVGAGVADGQIFTSVTLPGVDQSPLRKKVELVLARAYDDNPANVAFIAATAARSTARSNAC